MTTQELEVEQEVEVEFEEEHRPRKEMPASPDRSLVTITMTKAAKVRLKVFAIERGMTVAALVREVLTPLIGRDDPVVQVATERPVSHFAIPQHDHPHPRLIPSDELEVSVRVANVLHELKLSTVGEVLAFGPNRLMKAKNFGKVSLLNLTEELRGIGVPWTFPDGEVRAAALRGSDFEVEKLPALRLVPELPLVPACPGLKETSNG